MRISLALALALTCTLGFDGCSKGEQSGTTTTTTTDASPAAAASAAVSSTPAAELSPSPVAVPSASATPSTSGRPSPLATTAVVTVAFTDIAGANGEKEIIALGQLGVLDATSGAFHSGDPIKRRDFVRWLFKTNNAVWQDQPGRQIRVADATAHSDFSDLPSSDPDFRYVQGLSDAGIAVGFPDKSFKPNEPLTREQMIAIKSGLDRGGVHKSFANDDNYARYNMPAWKDKAKISKIYAAAIATDVDDDPHDGAPRIDNIGRTFGAIAMLRPQQPVTRGQAAIVLNVIGAHDESTVADKAPRSVAKVLTGVPGPSPTP